MEGERPVAATNMAATDMNECAERSVLLLYRVALLMFVFTVVVGILNGTDAVDFDHKTLMTHVHAGTLGWISLCVFGAALQMFVGRAPISGWQASTVRFLPPLSAAVIVGYVAMFLITTDVARPIMGTAALVVMVWWFAWVLARTSTTTMSVPRVALTAALLSLAIGAVLGVLLGIQLSGKADVLPDGGSDAHPAAMVIGFLVPVAMGMVEWILRPSAREEKATRIGYLQVGFPFVGGILIMIGLLADIVPLVGMSLPFEVAGAGILLRRMWPSLRAIDWKSTSYDRTAALGAMFLVIDLALLVFLIIRYQGDLDTAPTNRILALDHTMFIGVMTNSIFAQVSSRVPRPLPDWVHHGIVLAVNIGLMGFAVGLFSDSTPLKRSFTPILGTGILIAIWSFVLRMRNVAQAAEA